MDAQNETARSEQQFQELFDPETGVPTMALLRDRVHSAILRSRRIEKAVLVAWIEVKIPEPAESRWFVRDVVHRLRSSLRVDDTIARVGPREFVVVCNDLSSGEDVPRIVERLLGTKQRPLTIVGDETQPISRIGVVLDEGSLDPHQLLERAHAAMLADE